MQLDNIVQLNIIGVIIMCSLVFNLSPIKEQSVVKKYFNYLFNIVFIMLTVDIISFLLTQSNNLNLTNINYFLISLIHVSYVVPVIIWLLIMIDDIEFDENKEKMIKIGTIVVYLVLLMLVLTNPLTNWMFSLSILNQYTRGPLFAIYPIINIGVGIVGAILLYKKGRIAINPKHRNYFIALIIMQIGVVFQVFLPTHSPFWMACSVALIFVYSGILGNTSRMDERTGLYSYQYQKSIISDYNEYGIPYVLIQFTPFESDALDTFSFNEFAKKITSTFNDLGIFAAHNNAIILLSRSSNIRTLTRHIQDERENEEDFIYGILEEYIGEKKTP